MLLSSIVAVALLGISVEAQLFPSQSSSSPPPPATGTPTGSAPAATHTIGVGATAHRYTPANLTAKIGDVIEWVFYPGGHSVIRAEYEFPCTPYEYIGIGRQGFYSGPQDVQAITNDLPRFRVTVNDTKPIFYYCGAPGSCYKEKMIGVINPSENQTLAGQLKAAEGLTYQILPGEPFPSESGFPSSTAPPTASPTKSGSSTPSDGSHDHDNDNNDHPHLTAGQIAGIAIGGAAVAVLAAALLYLCGRRGGLYTAYRRSAAPTFQQPPAAPMVEAKYPPNTPKSPGTETWSTSRYSSIPPPPHDPYRSGSPGQFGPRSPPLSPHHTPGYGNYPGGMVSPGLDGTQIAYYDPRSAQGSPPPAAYAGQHPAYEQPQPPPQPPVELPTSANPGHSPLPNYQSPTFSFAGNEEAGYRPSNTK